MGGDDWNPDDETPLPFCGRCGRPEGECDCTDLDVAEDLILGFKELAEDLEVAGLAGDLCPCGASLIEGWCPACSDLGGEG